MRYSVTILAPSYSYDNYTNHRRIHYLASAGCPIAAALNFPRATTFLCTERYAAAARLLSCKFETGMRAYKHNCNHELCLSPYEPHAFIFATDIYPSNNVDIYDQRNTRKYFVCVSLL